MPVAGAELCASLGLRTRKIVQSGWRSALLKRGSVTVTFAHGIRA